MRANRLMEAIVCGEVCVPGRMWKVMSVSFGEWTKLKATHRSGQKVMPARSSIGMVPVVMKMVSGFANLSKRVKSSSLTSRSSGRVSTRKSAERMADSIDWVSERFESGESTEI